MLTTHPLSADEASVGGLDDYLTGRRVVVQDRGITAVSPKRSNRRGVLDKRIDSLSKLLETSGTPALSYAEVGCMLELCRQL